MHHHDERYAVDACDRHGVSDEIEVELLIKCRIDRIPDTDDEEHIAVGWCADDRLGGDVAASANPVLDDELLTEVLRKPLADEARSDVGAATSRKADDQSHRPRWVGLRGCYPRHGREPDSAHCQMQKLSASKLQGLPPMATPTRLYAEFEPPRRLRQLRAWQAALFRQGLERAGWSEGHALQTTVRWGDGRADRIRASAAELVRMNPDLIFTTGGTGLMALSSETRSIPILFAWTGDPVTTGLVASPAHPGGNATGFTGYQGSIATRWVQLLKEIAPAVSRLLVLGPGNAPGA
jgi:hypothetical protein